MFTFSQISFAVSFLALVSMFSFKWAEIKRGFPNPFRILRRLDSAVCSVVPRLKEIRLPDLSYFFRILSIILKHLGRLLSAFVYIAKSMVRDIAEVSKSRRVKKTSAPSSVLLKTMLEDKNHRNGHSVQ